MNTIYGDIPVVHIPSDSDTQYTPTDEERSEDTVYPEGGCVYVRGYGDGDTCTHEYGY
jgi:hypothetical protein